jgi:hypothetical protein
MTRRKMLLMTAGATVLGLAALIGFGDHNAIFADDDDDKAAAGSRGQRTARPGDLG